jgi:hypothetical protein
VPVCVGVLDIRVITLSLCVAWEGVWLHAAWSVEIKRDIGDNRGVEVRVKEACGLCSKLWLGLPCLCVVACATSRFLSACELKPSPTAVGL